MNWLSSLSCHHNNLCCSGKFEEHRVRDHEVTNNNFRVFDIIQNYYSQMSNNLSLGSPYTIFASVMSNSSLRSRGVAESEASRLSNSRMLGQLKGSVFHHLHGLPNPRLSLLYVLIKLQKQFLLIRISTKLCSLDYPL